MLISTRKLVHPSGLLGKTLAILSAPIVLYREQLDQTGSKQQSTK